MVDSAAVGAVGTPVNAGDASGAPDAVALASTKAVVATCVVFVPTVAVGAVGVPVNSALTSVAYVVDAVAVVR